MAFTVGDVITAAREFHPDFTKQTAPNRVLMGALSRFQRRLVVKVQAFLPDPFLTTHTVSMPLTTFPDSEAAIEHVAYYSGEAVWRDVPMRQVDPVSLVPWEGREQVLFPAYAVKEGNIFLVGEVQDWERYSSLELQYVPDPVAFTALTDAFILPDQALDACVALTAHRIASRVPKKANNAPDVRLYFAEAQEAEQTFINGMGARKRGYTHTKREVW